MANERLFELLSQALAQPSGAYKAASAALDIPNQALSGYDQGAAFGDRIRKRRNAQMSLVDVLGQENMNPELAPYGHVTQEDIPATATMVNAAAAMTKANREPLDKDTTPRSLDAYLTEEVRTGRMSVDDAFSKKNRGLLLRGGYQEEGGGLGEVPGGKPAKETAKEIALKRAAQMNMLSNARNVTAKVDEAMKAVGPWTTGLSGKVFSKLPATEASNLTETLKTIKANVGFQQLQDLRNSSPTGAALGPVSDRENELLQAAVSSLEQSQSDEQLIKNLGEVKERYNNVILAIENQTGDQEADAAIAQVISSRASAQEKKARIQGIRAEAGR